MAKPGVSGVYSSQFLVNSESNNEVNSCQRCRIYEVLLKETLDELDTNNQQDPTKGITSVYGPDEHVGIKPRSYK